MKITVIAVFIGDKTKAFIFKKVVILPFIMHLILVYPM
ncbi:hypothetical protein YPPY66_3260, partial [Yersinia pestis PY-66]